MKFKPTAAQALTVAALAAGLAVTGASTAHADYSSTSNRNWMEQVNQVNPNFKNLSLRDVILPGTHDSGTSPINPNSKLAPDLIPLVLRPFVPASFVAKPSRAQEMTAKEQLNAGVRYLDLRVGANIYMEDGYKVIRDEENLKTMHGVYGEDLDPILQATKEFLEQNQKEIVVLDFQHFYSMSDGGYARLLGKLETYLGSMMVPKSWGGYQEKQVTDENGQVKIEKSYDIGKLTLDTMWKSNRRVIVLFGSHHYWKSDSLTGDLSLQHDYWNDEMKDGDIPANIMNSSIIWGRKEAMNSKWVNTDKPSALKEDMDDVSKNSESEETRLHVMQNLLTPQFYLDKMKYMFIPTTTPVDPLPPKIADVAGDANDIAMNGLQGQWYDENKKIRPVNIVMMDMFNWTDAVNVIKKINMSRPDASGTEEGVYVYQHSDYTGAWNRFLGDAENLSTFNVGANSITSMKIVGPYSVELYSGVNFTGTKTVVRNNVANASATLPGVNDNVGSLRVVRDGEEEGVFLYEHGNYEGKRVRLTGDEAAMALTTLGNDTASSIQIAGNYSVTAYADGNFSGSATTLTGSAASLPSGWSDRISSVKIVDLAPEVTADKRSLAIGFGAGDGKQNVKQNLALPTSGARGTSITWTSSNSAIISASGQVTRPLNGDVLVTLTATLAKGSMRDTKTFTVTVLDGANEKAVELDTAELKVGFNGGDTASNVNQSLVLPTEGARGTAISWTSSRADVLEPNGTLHDRTGGNLPVALTATIKKGGATSTKTFNVTVIDKSTRLDAQALAIRYLNGDTAESIKSSQIVLPRNGANGTTIFWSSSDPAIISDQGIVTRQTDGSHMVTLTAKLVKYAGTEQTKTFTVNVIDISPELDSSRIHIGYINNDSPGMLWNNITLPTQGDYGSAITWMSSNPAVLDNTGKVTAPERATAPVTLLAIVTKGNASFTRSYQMKVGDQAAPLDAEAIKIGYASGEEYNTITQNITLPTAGERGTTISWASDRPDVLAADGTVKRPLGGDVTVALDATVTGTSSYLTKRFLVVVRGISAAIGLQAEDAQEASIGKLGTAGSGWKGRGFWNFDNGEGHIRWTFDAPADGNYELSFVYANGGTADRLMKLWLDGAAIDNTFAFAPTGSWNMNWKQVKKTVSLSAGQHTFTLETRAQSGPNLDEVIITSVPEQ